MTGQGRKDGCPRCLRRDNEPKTWDESTGKATYRCMCGHAWATWWEHSGTETGLSNLADLTDTFIANLNRPKERTTVTATNPQRTTP